MGKRYFPDLKGGRLQRHRNIRDRILRDGHVLPVVGVSESPHDHRIASHGQLLETGRQGQAPHCHHTVGGRDIDLQESLDLDEGGLVEHVVACELDPAGRLAVSGLSKDEPVPALGNVSHDEGRQALVITINPDFGAVRVRNDFQTLLARGRLRRWFLGRRGRPFRDGHRAERGPRRGCAGSQEHAGKPQSKQRGNGGPNGAHPLNVAPWREGLQGCISFRSSARHGVLKNRR